jgi:hypothetical protein
MESPAGGSRVDLPLAARLIEQAHPTLIIDPTSAIDTVVDSFEALNNELADQQLANPGDIRHGWSGAGE